MFYYGGQVDNTLQKIFPLNIYELLAKKYKK